MNQQNNQNNQQPPQQTNAQQMNPDASMFVSVIYIFLTFFLFFRSQRPFFIASEYFTMQNSALFVFQENFCKKRLHIENILDDGTMHFGPLGELYLKRFATVLRKVTLYGEKLHQYQAHIEHYFRFDHCVPIDELCFRDWQYKKHILNENNFVHLPKNVKVLELEGVVMGDIVSIVSKSPKIERLILRGVTSSILCSYIHLNIIILCIFFRELT